MARIRTLKPEFWNSPSTAQADLAVRLTFMAMWNWADDSGHGTANLKELEAFCWPNDDVRDLPRRTPSAERRGKSAAPAGEWRNFAEILGEVAEVYGVVFYRVAGRPYYEISNFKRHQSKDYRKESRYPLPDEGEIYDVTSGNVRAEPEQLTTFNPPPAAIAGKSAAPAGMSGIGTGETVTGEPGAKHSPTVPAEEAPTAPRKTSARSDYSPEFETFWSAYPRKGSKPTAWKAWCKALNRATVEQITAGARRYAADPNREDSYTKHGATWLNADCWNDPPHPPRNGSTRAAAQHTKAHAWSEFEAAGTTDYDHPDVLDLPTTHYAIQGPDNDPRTQF